MRFEEHIIFNPQGGIDTDNSARAVAKGDYRMFDYCRLGQTTGEGFTVVTSQGTIEINNPDITIYDNIVGTGVWQKEYSIIYLVAKAVGDDEIWQYEISTQSHIFVAASADFEFSAFYYHVDIIDDIAKFTNGYWNDAQYNPTTGGKLYNPPYQINLRKAIDGEYAVIDLQVIDAIKWPPLPPVCEYSTDQDRADNKLRRKLFRFRVQYIYENSEESAWSLWSNLALPSQSEFVSGNNWPDSSQDNLLNVTFETGPNVVKKINLAVLIYDDNSGGAETEFGLFLQLDKANDLIGDDTVYTHAFYGGVSSKPISNSIKNYDRLPLVSLCESLIENTRLTYSNFREGYDKIDIDITGSYAITEILWKATSSLLEVESTATSFFCKFHWSDLTYFNVSAGETYSVYLLLTNGNTLGLQYIITQADIDAALLEATVPDQLVYILNVIVSAYAVQASAITGTTFTVVPDFPFLNDYSLETDMSLLFADNAATISAPRLTLSTPSLKVGATHEFGIVYGDRAQRDGTVLNKAAMNVFVPWYSDIDTSTFTNDRNPFLTLATQSINNLPPIWATRYWIVARKATEIADFSQWVVNALPGVSAYTPENDRYVITLDKYYLNTYTGASINHTPQKGDIARFVRQEISDNAEAAPFPYVQSYFELEVQEYLQSEGPLYQAAIVVERFDLSLISAAGTWNAQVIEIYTPRPVLDTDGNLFVAEWRDITEALEIIDPHTTNRSHSGNGELVCDVFELGVVTGNTVGTMVDLSIFPLDPDPFITEIVFTNDDGETQTSTTNLIVDLGGGEYKVIFDDALLYDFTAANGGVFTLTLNQQVVSGVSITPATLNLGYGDVYVRQRNYGTGYGAGSGGITNAFWFIEDPHYSDYWLSDIHQMGRFALESPTAKLIHRKASSIHSEVYFPDTQINGLSSFSFIDPIVQDMNPVFGEIVRTYESGRENKTLKCIQERKENSIYIQHYPQEALPEGSLVINKTSVFSAWYPYKQRYGCKTSGATALWPDGTTYYFDVVNGIFVMSATNGQVVISERDPESGMDGRFRKKTKELTARVQADPDSYIKTYTDVLQNEIGFCFAFTLLPSEIGIVLAANIGDTTYVVSGDLTGYLGSIIQITELADDYSAEILTVTYDSDNDESTLTLSVAAPATGNGRYITSIVYEYEIVTFDVINRRWRSRYDYNFLCFENFGQTLVGFGKNNQLYAHNEDSITFHGDSFIEKVTVVSNENPLELKRYQNMVQRSNKTFSVYAYAETNQSYTEMATTMENARFSIYEGYSKAPYAKNVFSKGYLSAAMAQMNGEDLRAHSITHELTYDPSIDGEGAILFSVEIDGVIS